MYILFINSSNKCDIFFLLNLIIKKKNCPTHGFNPIQPNPCGLGWIYVIRWVEFFLPIMMGWVKKSPQPDLCTPLIVFIMVPYHVIGVICSQLRSYLSRDHQYI